MVGHVIEKICNCCLTTGHQNTIRRNLFIYVGFTSRTRTQLTKVKVILHQRNHTGNQQPFHSLTETIRLQACGTKQNIHPFFLRKSFPAIFYLIHIHVRHLDGRQLPNTNGLRIFLIFLNKFILHLQDTPDTATEQSVIILHIIRMNRNPLYAKIRKSRLITVFFGIQYYCNTINDCVAAPFPQKRKNFLCLIRTHIVISQDTLYILHPFFNNLFIIGITILSEEIFQNINRNVGSFPDRFCQILPDDTTVIILTELLLDFFVFVVGCIFRCVIKFIHSLIPLCSSFLIFYNPFTKTFAAFSDKDSVFLQPR